MRRKREKNVANANVFAYLFRDISAILYHFFFSLTHIVHLKKKERKKLIAIRSILNESTDFLL